ncbi:MAG TPA: MBL fold metallo-hydrolase [Ktedonobacterales bacterium]|nr:MBL fold metallo-hydrolase [Ktedonobacterales bacterium]
MELTFHGAAGGVTGSCHLLFARGKHILVDCGLFQGADTTTEQYTNDFGFDPRQVDYLLLTHAHLDHCGRMPLLVKHGFRGEIFATAATRDLARLVLMDAAGLQVEEARRAGRHHRRHGDPPLQPAFDVPDVFDAMERFGRVARYQHALQLCPGIRATFGDAGHILGSAWILLDIEEQGEHRRVVFSGDLGNRGKPIVNPPSPAPQADFVVMESTYGDRVHQSVEASVQELKQAIAETLKRGGNIVIPTFALERAQDLLYCLRELVEHQDLPYHLPVYLDSPMAISATDIFRRHPECLNARTQALFSDDHDPFTLPGVHFTRDTLQSMAINQVSGGAVIMAGSGMATGGRILHHLRHNLWREESSIVFVGYAAEGTLARRIIDGQRYVNIFGEEVRVAARVYTIGGFSAHADQHELLTWHRTSGTPVTTFLVHGEDAQRATLAQALQRLGFRVERPGLHASFAL